MNRQLTAPLAGTLTAADAAVSQTADAALTGSGSISSVQFYANGILVGTDSSAPYAATWTPTVAGSYKLTSRAVASTGKVANAQGIASVEFYDGSTLLHTDTASPWTYNWTSAGEGSHTIKAKAFDTLGAWTESSQDVESVSVSANLVAGQTALVTWHHVFKLELQKINGPLSQTKFYYRIFLQIKNGQVVSWSFSIITEAEFNQIVGKK